jgi:hypothetical protein
MFPTASIHVNREFKDKCWKTVTDSILKEYKGRHRRRKVSLVNTLKKNFGIKKPACKKDYLEDVDCICLSKKLKTLMNLNRYYAMRTDETNVHRPLEDYTESESENDFIMEERNCKVFICCLF